MSDARKVSAAPVRPSSQALRVVLVLDPIRGTPPLAASLDVAGVDLVLHLAPLSAIVPGVPFLGGADVLIVEVDPAAPDETMTLARIVGENPSLPVVAAGRDLTLAASRRLRAFGAVEVVSLPIDAVELGDALDAVRRTLTVPASRRGRIVAVHGALGGAGTTMVATQLGCLWAATRSTCLIDFNLQAATAALYLDMTPPLSLADLAEARGRLDGALLTSVAARHASGLSVIAGPPEMVPLDLLGPGSATDILKLATQAFEVVLVDLPAAWTDWSIATLSAADAILLVTALSVPGVRQARRQLDVIEANGLGAATRVVLNRVPKKLFRTVDLGDAEALLRRRVDHSIANDYPTVSAAIDQGRTIGAVKPGCPVEKDLKKLRDMVDAGFAEAAA